MDGNLKYRPIEDGEEDRVHDLILRVFYRYVAPTYSMEGIDTFTGMLTPSFLVEKKAGKFTVVAELEGRILGVLTMINASHIALLFVESEFQGNGVGKGLIRCGVDLALGRSPVLNTITVSSSPNSTSFYKSVGFEAAGDEKDENGMRFLPMGIKVS